jgi:predicted RNA-binding Zn-ribbon protein involved in translation (DUF1610 family)
MATLTSIRSEELVGYSCPNKCSVPLVIKPASMGATQMIYQCPKCKREIEASYLTSQENAANELFEKGRLLLETEVPKELRQSVFNQVLKLFEKCLSIRESILSPLNKGIDSFYCSLLTIWIKI